MLTKALRPDAPFSILKPIFPCRLPVLIALMALWSLLVPADKTWGKERIRELSVEVLGQEILVSATLKGGFNRKVVKDIQNGIPKDFYYYVLLKKKDPNWFDEEILSKTIRYRVKYDTLKQNYLLTETIEQKSVKKTIEKFEQMKKRVTRIEDLSLAPASILKQGQRYYVSVKSQMQAAKRPFYLDYFLFFIPFLEVDTPWANSAQIVSEKPLSGLK